ncbi:ornithine cyclodeaminase [Cryptococcus deuterogattii LA55]|nr:ornithine cyclodeaminase [Cryptococcus deuterogattii LA55]KIR92827.1 ornithine cyclodeaminase [Cryptococcus deuterogattii CBS 10090]
MSLRILTGSQVDSILANLPLHPALESQANVFRAFTRQAEGVTNDQQGAAPIQTPHRLTVNSDEFSMLFMPSRAPTGTTGQIGQGGKEQTTTACKIVSVPSAGSAEGLPASTIIMDEESGKVKALMNARKLTALRNACGSAVFLSLFPPAATKHLLLFGSGAQCLSHALLFLRLHSFSQVTFVVRSINQRSQSSASAIESQFPTAKVSLAMHSSPSNELSQLVSTADVIVTATSSLTPLFDSSPTCPKPGARVIMIGSYKPEMHEIDQALMKRAAKVVVDSRKACEREAGEIIDAGKQVAGGAGLVELGELLGDTGLPGETVKDDSGDAFGKEVVIFKSVGIGIQDVAISKVVLEQAETNSIGTVIGDYD